MSGASRVVGDSLPLAVERQIDAACVRFEDAWRAGRRPALEQYLDDVPPDGRAELLRELLKLDLHYRRRLGERPTPDEYRPRVPEDAGLLHRVIAGTFAADHDAADGAAEPGAVIAGRYTLREKVGEGGMGEVWAAEQTRPVRRQVAVKLIKAGMDSKAVLSRFEAESQALSLMDHPNIATVLDGGRTAGGRPFFAMEFIPGTPITRYCDDARLGVRERVGLFVPVCRAVQHAHQKGVIHRDLKPSNVLVGLHDGRPVPKVIDFGLAKALHQPLTDGTLHTAPGAVLGTPLYMSPEQAEFDNLDIDTRTDVYSLGVILYELLTGTTPLDKARFKDGAWPEALRRIKEEDPPKPSTRLSDTPPDVAARRNLEPARLARLVRGELDWIVMKCLEKDRSRRYESANGLAADLERYLAGEPVLAAPPGAAYRLRKFVRKHRGPVVAAALVVLALVAGVVGTAVGLVRAKQKEAEAAAALAFVEEKVFAAGRPAGVEGGLGRDVKLIDSVRAAVPYVEQSFKDQPLIEARLRMTLARSFNYLADFDAAEVQSFEALRLRAAHLGPDHPDTFVSVTSLADNFAGRERHAEAIALLDDVLPRLKSKLGLDHSDTIEAMRSLAHSYGQRARYAEALKLREDMAAILRAKLGPDHADTLWGSYTLAQSYRSSGRLTDAVTLYEAVLPLQRSRLGPDHADTLGTMQALAITYREVGRHDEALKLARAVLARRKEIFGPDHFLTLASMWSLAESLIHLKQGDAAVALLDECLRRAGGKPENGRQIGAALAVLQRIYAGQGDATRCRAIAEQWEKFGRTDPISLYNAACFRSIASAAALKDSTVADAPGFAAAEADRAMAWLRRAVEAGMQNVAHMEKDTDLEALHERDDFKRLLADLRRKADAARK